MLPLLSMAMLWRFSNSPGPRPTRPKLRARAHQLPVAAPDHMDLAIGVVRGEPIGLPLIRPEHGRAGHTRRRRVAQDRDFAHKGTVLLEHLDAVVAAVG